MIAYGTAETGKQPAPREYGKLAADAKEAAATADAKAAAMKPLIGLVVIGAVGVAALFWMMGRKG